MTVEEIKGAQLTQLEKLRMEYVDRQEAEIRDLKLLANVWAGVAVVALAGLVVVVVYALGIVGGRR